MIRAGAAGSGIIFSGDGANFNLGSDVGEDLCATLVIYEPHSSGNRKRLVTATEYSNTAGEAVSTRGGGHNTAETGAITGVRFIPDTTGTTTFTAGTVLVFGLRAANPALPYPVAAQKIAAPAASEKVLRYVFEAAVDFVDDFAGSRLSAGVAATASTAFDLRKNGASIGSITVAAAGTTGTFLTTGGAAAFAAGDVIEIVAPAAPDATLAQIAVTLAGTTPAP